MRNFAEVPCSVVAKSTFGYSKAECYSHNPSKAKALLREAGYPAGLELRFISPSGRYLMDRETAEAVQAQLADVGIRARLTLMEWAAFLADARRPVAQTTYDLALWGFGPATNDSDFVLNTLFHSSAFPPGGNNIAHYRNEEVDRKIGEARATVDLEKRKAIYARIFPIVMRDAPAIFLHEVKQIYGFRANVQGLRFYPVELVGIAGASKTR
jgi:peptide/nickel transport system substrate-binding protein